MRSGFLSLTVVTGVDIPIFDNLSNFAYVYYRCHIGVIFHMFGKLISQCLTKKITILVQVLQ